MNEPHRHHFVPAFYLSKWVEADGMVTWYTRREGGEIEEGRAKPDRIAFENRLYSYEKVPPEQRQAVEKFFFAREVDERAAPILNKVIAGGPRSLSPEERVYWTRFMIAARLRVPEVVNDLKRTAGEELRRSLTEDHEDYLDAKGEIDAPTLLGWVEQTFVGLTDNFGMMILPEIITDPEHTRIISDMHWWTMDLSTANVRLLTSDRPLWVSTGLKKPNCLLVMPLSPTHVFFASRNRDFEAAIRNEGANRVVRRCNESLTSQADKFVYGHQTGRADIGDQGGDEGRIVGPPLFAPDIADDGADEDRRDDGKQLVEHGLGLSPWMGRGGGGSGGAWRRGPVIRPRRSAGCWSPRGCRRARRR